MQSPNRKKILIISSVVVLVIIGAAVLLFSNHSSKSPGSTYVDPLSHQTVSSPPGKTPDTYGTVADQPLYLGFDRLLDHGLTLVQINNLKAAFYKYSLAQSPHLKEISIAVDNITTSYKQTAHSTVFYIYFNGRFDRAMPFNAKIQYNGIDDVRLFLSNNNNKQVFDSGIINYSGE